MAHEGKLRPINRFITTHRDDGKAVFSTQVSEDSTMKPLPDSMGFALSYTTQTFPVDMDDDKDITAYSKFLQNPPGLTLPGGTVLRHVDFPPSNSPIMHRTVSLDYGVVLEGEVECILDSGETRLLKRGDVRESAILFSGEKISRSLIDMLLTRCFDRGALGECLL